jgi:hypothetical protein
MAGNAHASGGGVTGAMGYAEILRNRVAFARTFMNTFHEEDQRIMGHAADGGMKAPITVSG